MKDRDFLEEKADLKLIYLLYRGRLWAAALITLCFAAAFGGIYLLMHTVFAPGRVYEATAKLYLDFARDDNGDAYQYYNGYTWNDILDTSLIMDGIMSRLPDMDRDRVSRATTADILSDIRVLTVTVATEDRDSTQRIADAVCEAIPEFALGAKEFEQIRVIEPPVSALVTVDLQTVRVTLVGAALGFLVSVLLLAVACIMDDAYYLPYQADQRLSLHGMGACYGASAEAGELFKNNIRGVLSLNGIKDMTEVSYVEPEEEPDFEKLRQAAGVVVRIPFGRKNGRKVHLLVRELRAQKVKLLGALITGADEKLYKRYYG